MDGKTGKTFCCEDSEEGSLKVYRYPFSVHLHLSISPLPSELALTGGGGYQAKLTSMSQDKGGAEAINMTRAPLARPFSPDPLSGEEASRRRILSENKLSSGCGLGAVLWARPPSLWRRLPRMRSTIPTRGRFMNARDLGKH